MPTAPIQSTVESGLRCAGDAARQRRTRITPSPPSADDAQRSPQPYSDVQHGRLSWISSGFTGHPSQQSGSGVLKKRTPTSCRPKRGDPAGRQDDAFRPRFPRGDRTEKPAARGRAARGRRCRRGSRVTPRAGTFEALSAGEEPREPDGDQQRSEPVLRTPPPREQARADERPADQRRDHGEARRPSDRW